MAKITAKELGNILVGKGFLTNEQVKDCLAAQKEALSDGAKKPFLNIAVEKGYLTEAQKAEAVSTAKDSIAKPPTAKAPAGPAPEIPGFKIEAEIGRGAMGTVFKGYQVSLDRPVAIKILSKSVSEDKSFVERFLKEAKTAAKLNHPNIVGAIDAGEVGGTYYFIMEYVDGEDIKRLLSREGSLSEKRALEITKQIADALAHAETLDMVHRDIKPENIMIAADGTAKLSDLGLARQILDSSVTMAGKVIGTPHYMSPEQVEGLTDLDVRSDIYSLGATLYQMLTNTFPFTADNPTAVLHKHLTAPRPDPSKVNPSVSRPVCTLVRRMMARDRARRPQSAGELKELIARTQEEPVPSQSAAKPVAEKKSVSVVPLIVGGGIVGVAAALIFILVLRGGGKIEAPVEPVPAEPAVSEPEPAEPKPDPEKEAKQALSAAANYWGKHPKAPLTALERFEEVARRHPDTKAARDASSEASAIRLQIDGALTAVKASVDQLLAERNFKAAEQEYRQFLASFPLDPWRKQANEGIANVRAKAQEEFRDIQERVEQLVSDGKHSEALQILMDSAGKMTAETARAVSEKMKGIEKDMEKADEKRRKREVLLADARTRAINSLQGGDLRSLMETCERQKGDSRFEEVRDLLAKDAEEFRRADSVLKKAEQGAAEKIGKRFTVQGITGEITSVEDGVITLQSGQVRFSRPMWKLKTDEILELAGIGTDGGGDPLGAAMFYMCRGEYEKSREILDKQSGAEAEVQTAILDEMEVSAVEAEVERLIASFKKCAADKKWADAYSAFETLRNEYGHTKTFAAARAALEKEGETVRQELERSAPKDTKVESGLAGFVVDASPVSVKKGIYRGKYEFDSAKELQDWEVEKAVARSSWKVEDGTLVGRGDTRIKNNIPFVGDLVVEAVIHSGSNFTLHIGRYQFSWSRYYTEHSSKIRMRSYKDGDAIPGCNKSCSIPVGTTRLRWVKQGNTITWYREGKKISQVKEKGRMEKNSTLRLETAVDYFFDTEIGRGKLVKLDNLLFLGMVDIKRLKEE